MDGLSKKKSTLSGGQEVRSIGLLMASGSSRRMGYLYSFGTDAELHFTDGSEFDLYDIEPIPTVMVGILYS